MAWALLGGLRRPTVAFVNNDQSNRTVKVGDRRLGVKEYEARLAEEVDLKRMKADEAAEALAAGRVAAVITLPEGFINDLQSGIRPPVVTVQPSNRSPIEAQSISRRLESSIYRLNQELAQTYIKQTLDLVRIVVEGGDVAVFTRTGSILGLEKSDVLVRDLQQRLRAQGRVNPTGSSLLWSDFNEANLEAMLTSELYSWPATLAILVLAFGALVCLVIGVVLIVAVALTTSLSVGRWAYWPPAFLATGLAFAAFGVLVGALARETRTALLAALMLALPLIFLGLFTQRGAASAISEALPFGPAFRIFQTLIVEPTVDPGPFWMRIGQLLLLTCAFGVAGSIALRRKSTA